MQALRSTNKFWTNNEATSLTYNSRFKQNKQENWFSDNCSPKKNNISGMELFKPHWITASFNKIFCKYFLNESYERCSCTGQKKDLISKNLFIGLNEQHAFTEGSFACTFMLLCTHNYVESRSAVLINVLYFCRLISAGIGKHGWE